MTTKKTTTKKPTTKPKTDAEKASDIVNERMELAARILCKVQAGCGAGFTGADVITVAGLIKDAEW